MEQKCYTPGTGLLETKVKHFYFKSHKLYIATWLYNVHRYIGCTFRVNDF